MVCGGARFSRNVNVQCGLRREYGGHVAIPHAASAGIAAAILTGFGILLGVLLFFLPCLRMHGAGRFLCVCCYFYFNGCGGCFRRVRAFVVAERREPRQHAKNGENTDGFFYLTHCSILACIHITWQKLCSKY